MKRRKSDKPEASLRVENAFANIMGASQKTFVARPMICLVADLGFLLGDKPSRPLTIKPLAEQLLTAVPILAISVA